MSYPVPVMEIGGNRNNSGWEMLAAMSGGGFGGMNSWWPLLFLLFGWGGWGGGWGGGFGRGGFGGLAAVAAEVVSAVLRWLTLLLPMLRTSQNLKPVQITARRHSPESITGCMSRM